mmetsp:Transcript_53328/g.140183  ORF Transcript_53328/g.140183 Transcript_53328/m.140183 type:complete len:331 (-) Transcript_53328:57-1049(-)
MKCFAIELSLFPRVGRRREDPLPQALAHDAVVGSCKLELQVEVDLVLGRGGKVDHMQHTLGRQLRAWLKRSVIQPAIAQCLVPTLALCGRCLRKQLLGDEELARVGEVELERRLQAALPRDVVKLERALRRQLPARAALEHLDPDAVERHVDPRLASLVHHSVVQRFREEAVPRLRQVEDVVPVGVLRVEAARAAAVGAAARLHVRQPHRLEVAVVLERLHDRLHAADVAHRPLRDPHRVEAELQREQVLVVLDAFGQRHRALQVDPVVRHVQVGDRRVVGEHVAESHRALVAEAVPPEVDLVEDLVVLDALRDRGAALGLERVPLEVDL